jgi:L-ascorbate metabolism protein UlaG (beta-lactamase superfamily)
MRVTFLGHACHLVEIDGVRVLTDPWLRDPIFEGLVEHDRPLGFGLDDLPGVDAIALTHAHLDHFNAPTLDLFPDKRIPVLHPPIRFTELDANLRALGFRQRIERDAYQPFRLGSVEIVPTPSLGVLDECAYLIRGTEGSFWDGGDAPQPEPLMRDLRRRFGPITLAALSHNSFDQPALLGLHSHKPADHGPLAAATSAEVLTVRAALPAASSMRWCGRDGDAVTAMVIRKSAADLRDEIASRRADIETLDLAPGDSWTPRGIERRHVSGATGAPAEHDYLHAYLGTGATWSSDERPSTADCFERDLRARTAAAPDASLYVDCTVTFHIEGEDAATYTCDFRRPGAKPERGDTGAPSAVRLSARDCRDLFTRRINWQVLLVSNRLVVERFAPGPPPRGLHFVYALQALFP